MPRRCALAPLAITHLNVLFPRPRPAVFACVPVLRSLLFPFARCPFFSRFTPDLLVSPFLFPSLMFLRLFPSTVPRGGHDTCQSTADARSIPTDLDFSSPPLSSVEWNGVSFALPSPSFTLFVPVLTHSNLTLLTTSYECSVLLPLCDYDALQA